MGVYSAGNISLAVVFTVALLAPQLLARRMLEIILNDFTLHSFGRVLVSRNLTDLLDADNITIFLPSSDAFFKYNTELTDPVTWTLLLTYTSKNGRHTLASLPKQGKITSRLGPDRFLYINTFYVDNRQVTTINGATITHADIIADNGVIHILDSIISPVSSGLTIAQYIEKPEDHTLSFSAIVMAEIVAQSLKLKTNSSQTLMTSFSPNDSYLMNMPDYGKTPLFDNITLLRQVYEAHIIENEALFLPYEMLEIPSKAAMFGTLRFYRRRGFLYVVNNRVHARVVKPNIATVNGVIHVIDNLLLYVYHNAVQITYNDNVNSTRMFNKCIKVLREDQVNKLATVTLTMFIPSDFAFSKSPLFWQRPFYASDHYTKIVGQHVIFGHALDTSTLYDGRRLTMSEDNLTVTVVHSEGDIYLETADKKIRSRLYVTDIGVTNGIVHLLDNLLSINFTIWEAMSDIPALKRIYEVIGSSPGNLKHILNMESEILTAFLPSNDVLDQHQDLIASMKKKDQDGFLNILKGHVAVGRYSTSLITEHVLLYTLSDRIITVIRKERSTTMTVVGGHVTSTVYVQDIYCKNGVIHVIDKLLHTPTQTLAEDISLRQEAAYWNVLISMQRDDQYDLNSVSTHYTMFVPSNESFGFLPWRTHEQMFSRNFSEQVVRAHIVKGETRTLDQIPSGSALPAINNVIYVLRKNGKTFVANNNIMAEVVKANVPAVNGWLHVINRVLTVPYESIADILSTRDDARLFHQMLFPIAEYHELLASSLRNATLFIPSSRYINTLSHEQLARIHGHVKILKKLFYGHVLPNVRLDDMFLRQYPNADYFSRSSFNVSFKISRREEVMYVGVGFDIQPLDVVGRALGCTDGIVYIIDGFLNYSPFTVLERLKREPGLSASFELMQQLVPPSEVNVLGNANMSYTFMMPDDIALDFFSLSQLQKLLNLPYSERHKTFWRHSINGSTIYYDDFKNGQVAPEDLPEDVSLDVQNEAVYLRYRSIHSKVKQWNLITSNGVIHILMQFLYEIKQPTAATVVPALPTNPSTRLGSLQAAAAVACSSVVLWATALLSVVMIFRLTYPVAGDSVCLV